MEKFIVGGGLLESEFEHQQDLNVFFTGSKFKLYWEVNKFLYKRLFTEFVEDDMLVVGIAGDYWDPLNFFNILYDQVDILEKYYRKPLTVVEHLRCLKLEKWPRYILLYSLVNIGIAFVVWVPEDEHEESQDIIDTCFNFLSGELKNLNKDLRIIDRATFDFDQAKPILNAIKTPSEKILRLLELKAYCKQEMAKNPDRYLDDGTTYINLCEAEIEHIKRLQSEGYYDSNSVQSQAYTAEALPPSATNNKQESHLLQYGYTKEQVLQYFMQLSKYYSEEQVVHFLKANFAGFAEPGEMVERVKLPLHVGLHKQHVMFMVYRFWKLQKEPKLTKKEAAILLETNFSCLESFNLDSTDPVEKRTVYNNMIKEPKIGYPFRSTMLG